MEGFRAAFLMNPSTTRTRRDRLFLPAVALLFALPLLFAPGRAFSQETVTRPAAVAPATAPSDDTANGDYGGYYTWPEMKTKMAEWTAKYPRLVHTTTLGRTLEGREIPLLRLSDRSSVAEGDIEVLLMAGIHPREQQPQVCLVRLIDELLAGYDKDPRLTRLLKERQIWVVPILNVDGKIHDMKAGDGRSRGADWRKNRRRNNDATVGVDLNRNFAVRWGGSRMLDPTWQTTTDNPAGNIYEGLSPLSEPESNALAVFLAQRRRRLRAFVDIHSPLRIILHPPYTVRSESERFRKIAEGMRSRQKDAYPLGATHPDEEPSADPRGGNSGLTYTWAYYTQGIYGFNFEIAGPPDTPRGIEARYPQVGWIEQEYRDNVREPLLFFLEAAGDLPATRPGSVTCAPGGGEFSGRLTPGATVTWNPPALEGKWDWAVLVSERPEVVVPSEYRLAPLRRGFTLQIDPRALPGTVIPLTLYIWDRNHTVTPLPFTLTLTVAPPEK